MQLSKQHLITAIDQGIERAKAAQVEWDANVDAAEAEWERRWREVTLPSLKPLRDMLTAAFKSGRHITSEDIAEFIKLPKYSDEKARGVYEPFVRSSWQGHPGHRYFKASHEYGPRPVLKIAAFETLRDFLNTVVDDSVSTSQLERAGFRNLNKLFEAAANGYWTD